MAKQPRSKGEKQPRAGLPPLGRKTERDEHYVVQLSPEKEELIDDALKLLEIDSKDKRLQAREHILTFIMPFYFNLQKIQKNAPRPADIHVTLDYLANLARDLSSALKVLDYWSLTFLQNQGAFRTLDRKRSPGSEFYALAEGNEGEQNLPESIKILRDIEYAAIEATKPYLKGGALRDHGGSRQLTIIGSPTAYLVGSCFRCFEQYRPGDATKTLGGDFQQFSSLVYEAATGKQSQLEKPIRRLFSRLERD